MTTMDIHQVMIVISVCLFGSMNGLNQCPDLIAGPQMVLSETSGWVGDRPVQVTCSQGYVLDTMTLQKNISCLANPTGAAWSDTLGKCQRKQCLHATTLLGSNMQLSGGNHSQQYYFGDNVTLLCEEGHAFHVNVTADVGNRVVTEKVVRCKDEENATFGIWEDFGNCSMITCGTPPTISGSVRFHSNLTYNSTVLYQCLSGLGFYSNVFHMTFLCNGSAEWAAVGFQSADLVSMFCGQLRKYVGCLSSGSLLPESETEVINNGVLFCQEHCQTLNKRFAGVHNGTCSCGVKLQDGYVKKVDTECDMHCPGYDGTSADQQAYCGGNGGQIAVYVTLDGCYESVTFSTEPQEIVTSDFEMTCKERCRGKDFSHAALQQDDRCFCLNTTAISAIETNEKLCMNRTFYNVTLIHDLALTQVKWKTCSELYEAGIRMNGDYYMTNPNRKETCFFKDGTICDEGWIGFNNYCYHFYNGTTLDFEEARDHCLSLDADLVSITSESEFDFLKETRKVFSDLWADETEPDWWLGLVDIKNTSLYTWVDGSMRTLSAFQEQPRDINKWCAGDRSKSQYFWLEMDCSSSKNVMCKKPKDGPSCANITALSPEAVRYQETMSVTNCVQFCKGQQKEYALVNNNTCNCVSSLPAYTEVPKSQCNTECPGNRFQYCGGDLNTYTVLNVSEKLAARSCEELQLIGIDNSTFIIHPDNETEQLQECGVSACPYSWIYLNDHCYKYILYGMKIEDAILTCAKEDAYMITVDTENEIIDVVAAASNISLYSSVEVWRVGLTALSLNGGLYRWSNGKIIQHSLWNNSAIGLAGSVVRVQTSNYTIWSAADAAKDMSKFICEKGNDYLGCYEIFGMLWDVALYNYEQMTIQQCVEYCKANNRPFAFINSTSCSCEASLTTDARGECVHECGGQDNQICGGPNVMSVYDVEVYPQYASSCADLFQAGIFLSGTYNISGTLQVCNFTGGSGCGSDGWISIGGHCYKHFPKAQQPHAETCREHSATQTSLLNIDEYKTLVDYIRGINFHGSHSRVFTGITDGNYHLDVFISEDGFLTDIALLTSKLLASDLHDSFGYISFRIDQSRSNEIDGGTVCKENKYMIGCFNRPAELAYTLSAFNSVELTLCRQLCIANESDITIIGKRFCACASNHQLSSFIAASGTKCDVHCSVHQDQFCGDGTTMWAYQTGIAEFPYATSCTHLYKTGVFLKGTYRLNASDPIQPYTEAQCGFEDETECPATWLGSSGICFKFFKELRTFESARSSCAKLDSFLFNPIDDSTIAFTSDFQNNSSLLDGATIWLTGITPIFYNTTYVSSNGHLVMSDYSSSDSLPEMYSVFNTLLLTWRKDTNKRSFICQTDKGYFGCKKITSPSNANYTDFTGNSLTQCIYWCHGQDYAFAAVSGRSCHCFSSSPAMTSAYGKCDVICEGGNSQICGGTDKDNSMLYTVTNITDMEGMTGSCQDLFQHGVTRPGWYSLRFNLTATYSKVQCFKNPNPLDYLTANIKSLSASTEKVKYAVKNIKLLFPYTTAWKPLNDVVGEFVKIILDREFLITSIIIAGLHTPSEQSYVNSYSIKYRDVLSGTLENYTHNGSQQISSGCSDSKVLCFHFLAEPFVTNEVRLYPETWHNSISLQVALAGQQFDQFNHSEKYIGCALDPEEKFGNFRPASNISDCITTCRANLYAFASLDSSDVCRCGNGDFSYGFVSDTSCPEGVTGVRIGSSPYRALYRTFYKHCDDPEYDLVGHGNITSIVPAASVPDIYPYRTEVNYTCEEGYELPDGNTVQVSHCLLSNTWSKVSHNCSITYCPSFTVANGDVNFTSLEFGSSATVTCHHGYWSNNNHEQMTVYCQYNKTWSTVPSCTVENLRSKQRVFSVQPDMIRESSAMVDEVRVRSRIDCASKCVDDYYCQGANFNSDVNKESGTCRLFRNSAMSGDLTHDSKWKYMELSP